MTEQPITITLNLFQGLFYFSVEFRFKIASRIFRIGVPRNNEKLLRLRIFIPNF
jgi:hypothetical protein